MKITSKLLFLGGILFLGFISINNVEVKAETLNSLNAKTGVVTNLKGGKILNVKSLKSKTISKNVSRGGYFKKIDSTPFEEESIGDRVVKYASKFLGVPYQFGAVGPNYFDCSGFTQYVYKNFGVEMPHYTVSQWEKGKLVQSKDLTEGDLVFFDTYAPLSHVGIYIGNGQFIHAPSSGKNVSISSLNEPYYSNKFKGGKRFLE